MIMKCERTAELLKEGKHVKIVALGDSLTYGWMVERGYIEVFDEMLKFKYPHASFEIVNRGLPGDTARGGFFRIQKHVIDEKPNLVLIQFALNDALSGFTPQDFYDTMKHIVSSVEETQAEILLLTSPLIYDEFMMKLARPYYDKIVSLGNERSIVVARVDKYWEEQINAGVKHKSLVQADLAHPTDAGHRLMAEAVMQHF